MYGAANGPYNASPVTTAPDSPSVKSRGYNPQIDDRYGLPLVVPFRTGFAAGAEAPPFL